MNKLKVKERINVGLVGIMDAYFKTVDSTLLVDERNALEAKILWTILRKLMTDIMAGPDDVQYEEVIEIVNGYKETFSKPEDFGIKVFEHPSNKACRKHHIDKINSIIDVSYKRIANWMIYIVFKDYMKGGSDNDRRKEADKGADDSKGCDGSKSV